MKKYFFISLFLLIMFCNVARGQYGPDYDLNNVFTVGNHSFIPLNTPGTSTQNISLILTTLNEFEKKFGVNVISYTIKEGGASKMYRGDLHYYNNVDGIWVTHRTK